MTTECAVCYVSDINFLLPTLVSATGLRRFIPAHKADVFIFLVDGDARIAEFNRLLKPYDIQVITMGSHVYGGFEIEKFNRSHVPHAALGRFFLADLLPTSCRRIVYLDGDTWMWRDPSALIEAAVPDGKFAAAEDMTSFRASNFLPRGRRLLPYLRQLGLNSKSGYFNTGVFAVSRDTWKTLSTEAFKFFVDNTAICKYHDQSALNAVVGNRRLCLSLRWNFQTPYRFMGIEKRIEPRIYHFHSHPKPWMGACRPWEDMFALYQTARAPLEVLNLPVKTVSADSLEKHNKLNWRKNLLLMSPLMGRLISLYTGISVYEKNAWL